MPGPAKGKGRVGRVIHLDDSLIESPWTGLDWMDGLAFAKLEDFPLFEHFLPDPSLENFPPIFTKLYPHQAEALDQAIKKHKFHRYSLAIYWPFNFNKDGYLLPNTPTNPSHRIQYPINTLSGHPMPALSLTKGTGVNMIPNLPTLTTTFPLNTNQQSNNPTSGDLAHTSTKNEPRASTELPPTVQHKVISLNSTPADLLAPKQPSEPHHKPDLEQSPHTTSREPDFIIPNPDLSTLERALT